MSRTILLYILYTYIRSTSFPIMRRVLRPGSLCMSMLRSKGLSCQSRNLDEITSSLSDIGSSEKILSRLDLI